MPKMKEVEQVRPGALLMTWREGLIILMVGAIIGVVVMALYAVFDKYLFSPTLCSDLNAGTGRCEDKLLYASGLAMIFGGVAALFFMVQQRVYRPLLIVILTVAALWNIPILLATLPLFSAVLLAAVVFGLGYGVFSWLVQLRNFTIALIVSIVIVFIIRLVLA